MGKVENTILIFNLFDNDNNLKLQQELKRHFDFQFLFHILSQGKQNGGVYGFINCREERVNQRRQTKCGDFYCGYETIYQRVYGCCVCCCWKD